MDVVEEGLSQENDDWVKVAKSDESIKSWWKTLTGKTEMAAMIENMKNDIDYDYAGAIRSGARPTMQSDGFYHWPSADPDTGRFFKRPWHPTMELELEARKRLGIPFDPVTGEFQISWPKKK